MLGLLPSAWADGPAVNGDSWLAAYRGRPFSDGNFTGPAVIPGRVECEYYDLGGEGVAYHDSDGVNRGSGLLNPVNGNPLNEFRLKEAVDISYTKAGGIDDNPLNRHQPPLGALYVGWTEPGEWLNYTVDVRRAGDYALDIPYTANGDGAISLTLDGRRRLATIRIPSTNDAKDPLAWRQWHHWARLTNAATVSLPAGRHVLTLTIEANGNMNLDLIAFRPAAEAAPAPAPRLPPAATWTPVDGANHPFGTPRGVRPGRVVWSRDPKAVSWDGQTGNWWEDRFNDQAAIDRLVANGIRRLAEAGSEADAWDALFRASNLKRGRGAVGYRPGEKVAIKINENNASSHAATAEINASPQLVLALLKSLVNGAGVPAADVTVFDASRYITDDVFDKCHAVFPGVRFVDHVGGDGRIKAAYVAGALPYSVDTHLATGLATCLVDATYAVNMAVLKGHGGQGVTLCAKNWYGATSIDPDWHKNHHDFFEAKRDGSPSYLTFVDFMGHKDMGAKTVLFVIDALYADDLVNGPPRRRWHLPPFNDSWPASVLLSQDGVAIDSVGIDFLRSEWPDSADLTCCDGYLHEAARAEAPPSGCLYDPERDGTRLESLGVHEHWNDARRKQYSRNLGSGDGIELVEVPAAPGKL
ncbi:MAG TPA: DUF362 domain-containing protein [Opitutaceae bacterium]|nr:DUF362 domain-containing protein [Opitutaceae bacterium]